jgi:hypothetical protein
MKTKYHYDRNGNYRGKTSNNPPESPNYGVGCLVLVGLFLLWKYFIPILILVIMATIIYNLMKK